MQLSHILEAKDRIKPYALVTPLIPIERLNEHLGFTPWVKLESLQSMGAFKIRGAMNAALKLSPEQLAHGLITASSGNHGRAVALAAKLLGVPSFIVLPETVTQFKREEIEKLGAKTLLVSPQERIRIAQEISDKDGYQFIHPYDHEDVLAGQGTIGLEILEQHPSVKTVFVPMGGGGLIGGISLAIKSLRPDVTVIGLEPAAVPKFSHNLNRETPLPVEVEPSIADALMSNKPGLLPLAIVKKHVDRVISVKEEFLKQAYSLLLQDGRIWCEPSSSIGFGAILQGELNDFDLTDSVFVISGGNIRLNEVQQVLTK